MGRSRLPLELSWARIPLEEVVEAELREEHQLSVAYYLEEADWG